MKPYVRADKVLVALGFQVASLAGYLAVRAIKVSLARWSAMPIVMSCALTVSTSALPYATKRSTVTGRAPVHDYELLTDIALNLAGANIHALPTHSSPANRCAIGAVIVTFAIHCANTRPPSAVARADPVLLAWES